MREGFRGHNPISLRSDGLPETDHRLHLEIFFEPEYPHFTSIAGLLVAAHACRVVARGSVVKHASGAQLPADRHSLLKIRSTPVTGPTVRPHVGSPYRLSFARTGND